MKEKEQASEQPCSPAGMLVHHQKEFCLRFEISANSDLLEACLSLGDGDLGRLGMEGVI